MICATVSIESGGGLRKVSQSIVAKVREPSNQSTASEYFFSGKQIRKKSLDLGKEFITTFPVV